MKIIYVLLAFFLFSFSCERTESCEDPKLDCANIRCFAFWSYFEFRIVDKSTGADLVFGNNSRYNSKEVKLFSDAARTIPVSLNIDETNKIFKAMTAREEMYLEIKGTNVYKLTAEFKPNDCCSNRVKGLRMDGEMICSCCTNAIPIPVN